MQEVLALMRNPFTALREMKARPQVWDVRAMPVWPLPILSEVDPTLLPFNPTTLPTVYRVQGFDIHDAKWQAQGLVTQVYMAGMKWCAERGMPCGVAVQDVKRIWPWERKGEPLPKRVEMEWE
jgi:hypothetical protein